MTDTYDDLLNDESPKEDSAVEGLSKEKEKLEREVAELRAVRRELKSTPQQKEEEAPKVQDSSFDTSTADGWVDYIKNSSEEATKPIAGELEKLKATNYKKAEREFMARHPEYAPSSDPEDKKLNSLLDIHKRVKSRTDYSHEDILEDLEDAWAVQNRNEIYEKDRQIRESRTQMEMDVADIASSGSGGAERSVSKAQGATASDHRSAKVAGMPIEKYMTLKSQLEEIEQY